MRTTGEHMDDIKEEIDYSQFISSFFSFQLSLLQTLQEDGAELSLRSQLERSLARSLSTIWMMHVLLFSKNSLHQKISDQESLGFSQRARSLDIELQLLKEMKAMIERHSFVHEQDKCSCLNFVEQLIPFYNVTNAQTVMETANELSKPWFSFKLKVTEGGKIENN